MFIVWERSTPEQLSRELPVWIVKRCRSECCAPAWLCLVQPGLRTPPFGTRVRLGGVAAYIVGLAQMYLLGGLETAAAHSQSSSDSSDLLTPCAEACLVASSTQEENPMFELSDSEELDVLSIEAGEIAESSPLHSHAHEELVDVLTPAVAKLNINWPQEGRKCK